jgi:hypothetical protein
VVSFSLFPRSRERSATSPFSFRRKRAGNAFGNRAAKIAFSRSGTFILTISPEGQPKPNSRGYSPRSGSYGPSRTGRSSRMSWERRAANSRPSHSLRPARISCFSSDRAIRALIPLSRADWGVSFGNFGLRARSGWRDANSASQFSSTHLSNCTSSSFRNRSRSRPSATVWTGGRGCAARATPVRMNTARARTDVRRMLVGTFLPPSPWVRSTIPSSNRKRKRPPRGGLPDIAARFRHAPAAGVASRGASHYPRAFSGSTGSCSSSAPPDLIRIA